jgi:hypothetical protein
VTRCGEDEEEAEEEEDEEEAEEEEAEEEEEEAGEEEEEEEGTRDVGPISCPHTPPLGGPPSQGVLRRATSVGKGSKASCVVFLTHG